MRGHVWQADSRMGQGNLCHVELCQVPESTRAVCSTYSRGSELSAMGCIQAVAAPTQTESYRRALAPSPRCATCDPAANLAPSSQKTYIACK